MQLNQRLKSKVISGVRARGRRAPPPAEAPRIERPVRGDAPGFAQSCSIKGAPLPAAAPGQSEAGLGTELTRTPPEHHIRVPLHPGTPHPAPGSSCSHPVVSLPAPICRVPPHPALWSTLVSVGLLCLKSQLRQG